jgi:beta-N-acetylhexosaminidase
MHPFNLTATQRAGQRLMVGFDGMAFNDTLQFYIQDLKVGGLILFARNISERDQVKRLCAAAQACAARCGQPPLFVGIDQEGGVVSRLKPPFTQFEGNPCIKSTSQAAEFARITSQELNQIGVNMNMAPVLDVLPAQGPSVMTHRSFGHDPQRVAALGNEMIRHFQQNGIMAVAKHFPGIGRTVLDSHEELPDLDIDADRLAQKDMVPFQAAIRAQVAGIMLSHIRYRQIDPLWPASLSPIITADILRRQMAYDGLVLTDDLDMGAVAKHYDVPIIVEQCLTAQVDLLLICHPGPKVETALMEISKQIQADETLAHQEALSIERILGAKKVYLPG